MATVYIGENGKAGATQVFGNGIKIKMAETDYDNIAIDTPEDLEKAKEILNSR